MDAKVRRHPIIPRPYVRNGVTKWRVIVPNDLHTAGISKTRHFINQKDALAYAAKLSKDRLAVTSDFLKLPAVQQSAILRRYDDENALKRISVEQAAKDCIESKRAKGIRKNSLASFKCSVRSLCEKYGSKSIHDITATHIDNWIASHPEWSQKTRLNNIKYASSLFAWCSNRDLIPKNPCRGVERPKVPFKPVQILTVPQIGTLLQTCQRADPALLGFICLVLFGGLRVTESQRCLPANVAGGVIDLGGEQTKLNLRRCIKISPQLAAWLAVPGVEIGGKDLNKRMKSLSAASGVVIPKNGLRHSFCSYNLQIHGAMITARMANNSETILNKHYLAMVTDEDAKAFGEILP